MCAAVTGAVWGAGRKVFKCVDVHCGGEPARVLLSGCPRVEGADLQEKRKYFMSELDQVRRVLLTEPRGYPCQNLNIILPPSDSRALLEQRPAARQLKCGSDGGVFTETTNTRRRETRLASCIILLFS